MRVLHLTSVFPRYEGDYLGRFILDLVQAQRLAGLEPAVVAPHDAGLPLRARTEGAEVRRFRYAPDRWELLAYRGGMLGPARTTAGAALLPGFAASFASAGLQAARQWRPDVLHAHWWLPAGLCALPAARLEHLPLVVTVHGTDLELLGNPWFKRAGRVVLRRAAAVAVTSEPMAGRLRSLGAVGRQPVVLPLVLPNGPPAVPLPPAPPVQVAAIGRLSHEKGFDVLLDAFGRALAGGLDAELTVAGDGPEGARLAALARPLGSRVRLVGAVPTGRVAGLIDAAHAVVVPSRREGFGMVALEAIARGRPVIATRVGGLPAVVDDGADGLLVPAGDAVSLAAALRRLPLPPPRGRALAVHRPEVVAAAHAAVYRQVSGRA